MANYVKSEAKEWAKEKFIGLENVLTPSFKQCRAEEMLEQMNIPKLGRKAIGGIFPKGTLYGLDEDGIRHDVEKCIEHGFFSTTVSLEFVSLINQDMVIRPYYRMVKEAAKGRILLDAYICNSTLEENLHNIKIAEQEGMDCIMLALPPYFYPKNETEIYEYVKTLCDSTNLGVVFYPSHKYNYQRFHPSRFSPDLIDKIAEIPNVIAIKLGVADIAHNIECMRRCGHKTLLNSPVIDWWPLFAGEFDMQWAGSAPYEYLQTTADKRLVRHFDLLRQGEKDKAMELYWQMTPARNTFNKYVMPMVEEGNYNIMHWKYLGWLGGMNGGTVPLSTGRLYEHQKQEYLQGLKASGISPEENDKSFYSGRVHESVHQLI